LVISLALHGAVLAGVLAAPRAARWQDAPDPWGGDTFEVGELVRDPPRKSPPAGQPVEPQPEPAAEPEPKPEPSKQPESAPKPEPASDPELEAPKPKPKPKPSPSAEATRASQPTGAPSAAPAAASTADTAPSGAGENYGAADLPPGVRLLPKAFTRAISAATNRDPIWDQLPAGDAGSVRVEVKLDEDGRILDTSTGDVEPPKHLKQLVTNTVFLLKRGRFALAPDRQGAGSVAFRIEVSLEQTEPAEEYDDPRHTVSMGFSAPTPDKPGRAYFVHASGRRFSARVVLER
jgi:outer membrane biosynthesis protein TonB